MRSGRLQVRPRSSHTRCVVCHAVAHASAATCDACGAVAHRGCARALVACPSLGCAGALVAPVAPPTLARRRPSLLHALPALVLAASALVFAASTASAPPSRATVAPPPTPRLARIRPAPSVAVDGLRSPDLIVRRDAALALGPMLRMFSITLPEVEALLFAAAHDPAPSVRARCDAAFVENAERARGHLVRALGHDDPEVRLVAADVLGRVPTAWSLKALLPRVDPAREPDARVRAVAAARLYRASPAILDALERRAHDEPDSLVWVIIRADLNEYHHASCGLVERTLPVLIDAAARAGRVGSACRDLLGHVGLCHSRAPLLDALAGDDPATRALAVTMLRRWLDEPGVSDALWRACRDDDDDEVRLAASSALAAAEGTMVRRAIFYESHCRMLDTDVPTAPPATRVSPVRSPRAD